MCKGGVRVPRFRAAARLCGLAAALLLAACGDRDNKKNSAQTDNSAVTGSNASHNSGESSGNSAKSRSKSGGDTFQHMLDNARVHDSDGDLTDGENRRW